MLSTEAQRVVVIQDASREVSLSAIRWILHGLSLKPGDMLTLISVIHQIINPSTFSFLGAGKTLGYKTRVDHSLLGANQKSVEDEITRKKKEYRNNIQLSQISTLYEMQKIGFKIEVDAGPSPKVVALEAAQKLRATWVILDRQMKKDKKYFLEKLSCGISRMKRDEIIEQLRGPKVVKVNSMLKQGRRTSQITYDEMLPGSPEAEDLFSIELVTTVSRSSLKSSESTSFTSSDDKSIMWHNLDERSKHPTKEIQAAVQLPLANTNEQEIPPHGSSIKDSVGLLKAEYTFDNSTCTICKNRRPSIAWDMSFSYAELLAATNGFAPDNIISVGGYGAVFKGKLKNKLTIAVKEQKDASFQRGFKPDTIQALRGTRHKNLVLLLGSCSEESHRLLVYEYVCNGSLDKHLSNQNSTTLSWGERIKIALGSARGLNHLHENKIIHRDIRPKNILVTHDHEPLVGGLGFARTHYELDKYLDHRVLGTFGYLAPEYAESGKTSRKTDVYSFGVVLLELITGRNTTDKRLEEKSLLGWARPLLKERKYSELIDPRVVDSHDSEQLIWMVQLAEQCLVKNPQKRLSMVEVVYSLEQIVDKKTSSGRRKPLLKNQIQRG